MNKYIVLIITLFTAAISVDAVEIGSINIIGNLKKTKNETIYNIIGFHVGDEIPSITADDIHQRILESGLFVDESIVVTIEVDDNIAIVNLTLDEKFSIIPIPIVQVSNGGFSAGVFLIESNFFGTGDQFFIGGLFSADSQLSMVNYYHNYIGGSAFSIGGSLLFSNEISKIIDPSGSVLDEFDCLKGNASLTVGWEDAPWGIYLKTTIETLNINNNSPVISFSPEIDFSFDNRYYSTYFSNGITAGLNVRSTLFSEDFETGYLARSSVSWGSEIISRLQISTSLNNILYMGDDLLSPSLKSVILPCSIHENVHANVVFQGNITVTPVLFDLNWSYIALPLTFTAGYFDGISGDSEYFYGPASSLTLCFKKVAIPAVSITYGLNLNTMEEQIQANIGFQL